MWHGHIPCLFDLLLLLSARLVLNLTLLPYPPHSHTMAKPCCKTTGCGFTADSTRSLAKHKCKIHLKNVASMLVKHKSTQAWLEQKDLCRDVLDEQEGGSGRYKVHDHTDPQAAFVSNTCQVYSDIEASIGSAQERVRSKWICICTKQTCKEYRIICESYMWLIMMQKPRYWHI